MTTLISILHALSLIVIGSLIVVELHMLPDLHLYQIHMVNAMTPWEQVSIQILTIINGILSLIVTFNLSRKWTTGKTDVNSCPFTILENIYSGHWQDRGGQAKKAKKAIFLALSLIILSHATLIATSLYFLGKL